MPLTLLLPAGTIKSAGKILVLDKGKIVESGSFEELDQPGSRFRSLMAAQLEASAPGAVEEEDAEADRIIVNSSVETETAQVANDTNSSTSSTTVRPDRS